MSPLMVTWREGSFVPSAVVTGHNGHGDRRTVHSETLHPRDSPRRIGSEFPLPGVAWPALITGLSRPSPW